MKILHKWVQLKSGLWVKLSKSLNIPILIFKPELWIKYYSAKEDKWYDCGLVACKVITNAGVAFLVDDWYDGSKDITSMNYHDSGTSTSAESVNDTALGYPCGEPRDLGTKSKPSSNQLRTVATHTYGGSFAITEHGLFSAATGGTLWDRSVFSAINVSSGDSIQFTYTLTVNAGG